ncbi:MAG: hypothetical protein NVS1B3_03100 [Candidatus Dormibacteraceae bacterium]
MLALDVDTMPGMAYSLGLPGIQARLPTGLALRIEGKGWIVGKGAGPARLVDRYSVRGADGLRLLELGKLPDRIEPSVSVAFRHVLERFRRPSWDMVADLAAGTRQAMFGWARFATVVLVVADPTVKSLISARRLVKVGTHLVANRVRDASDLERITGAVGLPLIGTVPYDEKLAEADRRGLAPIDFAPGSPGVAAIMDLAVRLIKEQR